MKTPLHRLRKGSCAHALDYRLLKYNNLLVITRFIFLKNLIFFFLCLPGGTGANSSGPGTHRSLVRLVQGICLMCTTCTQMIFIISCNYICLFQIVYLLNSFNKLFLIFESWCFYFRLIKTFGLGFHQRFNDDRNHQQNLAGNAINDIYHAQLS